MRPKLLTTAIANNMRNLGFLHAEKFKLNFLAFMSWRWPDKELLLFTKHPVKEATANKPAKIRMVFLQSKASTKACSVGPYIIVPSPGPEVAVASASALLLLKYWLTATGEEMYKDDIPIPNGTLKAR